MGEEGVGVDSSPQKDGSESPLKALLADEPLNLSTSDHTSSNSIQSALTDDPSPALRQLALDLRPPSCLRIDYTLELRSGLASAGQDPCDDPTKDPGLPPRGGKSPPKKRGVYPLSPAVGT